MSNLPITSDSLLKRLQKFDFLRGLDHETLVSLSKSAVWKVFAPDAVVFWEGDTETNLYYLQYGSLKILKTSPDGREQVLRFADSPQLGGSWLSLAGVTLGSIFLWVSIFIVPARGVLYGIGFALYALAMIPPVKELFDIARDGLKKIEYRLLQLSSVPQNHFFPVPNRITRATRMTKLPWLFFRHHDP